MISGRGLLAFARVQKVKRSIVIVGPTHSWMLCYFYEIPYESVENFLRVVGVYP